MNINYRTIQKHFERYDLMSSNTLRTQLPSHLQVHLAGRPYTPQTLQLHAQYEHHFVYIFSFSVVDHHQGPQADEGLPHTPFLFEYILETPTSLGGAFPAWC